MVIDHKSQMSRERNQEVAVYWRREGGCTDYCGIQERAHLPHFSVCIREAGDSVTITSSNSTAHNCQQTLNQIQHEKKNSGLVFSCRDLSFADTKRYQLSH